MLAKRLLTLRFTALFAMFNSISGVAWHVSDMAAVQYRQAPPFIRCQEHTAEGVNNYPL
jgi:hypothetical protein